MGCNAIRVTHNPASSALLRACDEQGMLVIEEMFDGWILSKNGNSHDFAEWFEEAVGDGNGVLGSSPAMTWAEFALTRTIKRDWNDPSIIMWSLGNEVLEGTNWLRASEYPSVGSKLIGWTTALDTSRKVTYGDNKFKRGSDNASLPKVFAEAGGVVGVNYASGSGLDSIHSQYPQMILQSSESASSVNSRGVYDRIDSQRDKNGDRCLTSYDRSRVNWGALARDAWYDVITRDYTTGEFVWTGFDYLGEPTPWNGTTAGSVHGWPAPKSSYFGILDTAGLPKSSYYFYRSQWNEEDTTLYFLPGSWNEDEVCKNSSNQVPVVVYSNAPKVQLLLKDSQGQLIQDYGSKTLTEKTTANGFKYRLAGGQEGSYNLALHWDIPYQPGMLEAVAYDADGREIKRTAVKTHGEASRITAEADRAEVPADGKSLVYVTLDIRDDQGNPVTDADNRLKVQVENGQLLGLDNGYENDHESYQSGSRKAFRGQLVAVVQAPAKAGQLKVTASSDGLQSTSVTLPAQAVSGSREGKVSYYKLPQNYYVKTGSELQLPSRISASYPDGRLEAVAVQWEDTDPALLKKSGAFTLNGKTAEGDAVSIKVNVLDKVAAVLNYSAQLPSGSVPILPSSRPAVLDDGTVLKVQIPVDWEMPDDEVFNKEGIQRIEGKARVFGQEIPVSASIRLSSPSINLGENIAPLADSISQNIPEELQSDTLQAVIDRNVLNYSQITGGTNPNAWTNFNNVNKTGNREAEITLTFATQQNIGKAVVYFYKDSYSARFPDANTTEILVSETGTEGSWKKIQAKESIQTPYKNDGNLAAYSYAFDPVQATYVKLHTISRDEDLKTRKACTGIAEFELYQSVSSYTTFTTAELDSLSIGGKSLSKTKLASSGYNTLEKSTESLQYAPKDNAAVTVVSNEKQAHLIIESEDHKTIRYFIINFGMEEPFDPQDDSMDYPAAKTAINVANEEKAQGDVKENALDGDPETLWHTNWNQSTPLPEDQRWVWLKMEEPGVVDGIRYLPRSSGPNGVITQYKVESSLDGQTWTEVKPAYGSWEASQGWKLASFEPVLAQYVRLTAMNTTGVSGPNRFVSAAELRIKLSDKPVPADKAALQQLVEANQEKDWQLYTEASVTAVKAALAKAEEVLQDSRASQEAVDQAKTALEAALERLEKKPEGGDQPEEPKPTPLKGWQLIDGNKRYYEEGKAVTGLKTLGKTTYLFDKEGNAQYEWHVVGGKALYFDPASGGMVTGLHQVGRTVYLFDSVKSKTAGAKLTGWHRLNGHDYYFDPQNGGMWTGKRLVGKTCYLFNSLNAKTLPGAKLDGWHRLSGYDYYFDPARGGGMVTGWQRIGKTDYLFDGMKGKRPGARLKTGK